MIKKIIHKAKFKNRHRARELAVQFLYSVDLKPEENIKSALELFLNMDEISINESQEVKEYCKELVSNFFLHKDEIDETLLKSVTNWRPERMVNVDRTILKLCILEAFIIKNLPPQSAISEAVSLASNFGTENSPRFVNGVLAKILREYKSCSQEF